MGEGVPIVGSSVWLLEALPPILRQRPKALGTLIFKRLGGT